jgi:hypothetical protein
MPWCLPSRQRPFQNGKKAKEVKEREKGEEEEKEEKEEKKSSGKLAFYLYDF